MRSYDDKKNKGFVIPVAQRRRLILGQLRDHGPVTRRALAHLCNSSLKTIQRDIEALRNDRWPIESLNDGYFLREPSVAERKESTNQHLAVLILAGCSVDKGLSHLAPDLTRQIKEEFLKLDNVPDVWGAERRAVESPQLPISGAELEFFGKLARHILNEELVRIHHRGIGRKEAVPREIYPVQLKEREGSWYLLAWDAERKSKRVFALSRISQVAISKMKFKRPAAEVLEEITAGGGFSIWDNSDAKPVRVRVRLWDYAAWIVQERPIHHSQKLDVISQNEVVLTLKTGDLLGVNLWLRKFAPLVKVLAPKSLLDDFRRDMQTALSRYD
ncbi:MAG: helix-turn-helix transcriptional regulator [Akkermansiaceae bacterium]